MAKKIKDPGFGYNSKENAKSILNHDGSSNVFHLNRKRNINDVYIFFLIFLGGNFFY